MNNGIGLMLSKRSPCGLTMLLNKRLDKVRNACCEEQQPDSTSKKTMMKTITTHLNKLFDQFNNYFPEKQTEDDWVHDPFGVDIESVMLPCNMPARRAIL